MPLQNRVDPFGNIHAVPHRGSWMGNRGILHGDHKNLLHYHRHKNWIICRLAFKGRKRVPMSLGKYTELFFLDEATALAAGHRPCAECNRARYNEFAWLWRQSSPNEFSRIDTILHRERFVPYRKDWRQKKRTHRVDIDALPDGTMITLDSSLETTPYLVLNDTLRPWSFAGYGEPVDRLVGREVTVLTPPSTVRVLAQGYRPQLHSSAAGNVEY